MSTKQDVHIKDGVLKGEAIQANIGGNLGIHSVQDTHDYTDHTTSGGLGLSLSKKGAFKSLQSSLQRTDIDSKYTSVIHQSGLYAGSTGFNISVGNTTTLEGALLASKTDTNTLKTKYLVMKDMENRAKYTYGSKGVSYLSDVQYRKSLEHMRDRKNAILTDKNLSIPAKIQHLQQLNQDKDYTSHLKYVNSLHNQVGLLPNMSPGERKEVHSVTRSAIAPGTIDIENPKVDVSQINRDINHSLQALDTIFNKQDIQERQELTKLFNKYANEAIHHISDMAGWKEGSSEKVALHAIVGNISANIVHGNTGIGTAAGGLSELLAPAILEASNGDPAKAQWLAYALGYATDKLAGGTGELGGSISHYGVKWNAFKDYYYQAYSVIVTKKSWIEHAIREALIEKIGTPNEIMEVNLGDGDILRIYVGHALNRLHSGQKHKGLPSFKGNNRDDILIAVIGVALNVIADGTLSVGRSKYFHTDMVLLDEYGKLQHVKVEVSVYRKEEKNYVISNFYPIEFIK